MTVGEAFGTTLEQTPLLVDDRRQELNMIFNFDAVRIDQQNGVWKNWTLPEFKAIYARQDGVLDAHCWNTVFLSNHDNPRIVSAFGDDSPAYRVASAKLLATMLLTLKGTPFVYQGDELGMTDYPFKAIEDFDDIEVKNAWKEYVLAHKVSAADFIANMRKTSRDNARTPMQWDISLNGGFTTAAKPWLAVNPNYPEINASSALADRDSIYHYYRRLIDLRRRAPALIYGDYKDLDPANPKVFAYTRTLGDEGYVIVLNLSRDPLLYALPESIHAGELQVSNLGSAEKHTNQLRLKAWEARVYKISVAGK
jgi:oligo-1,6-glucosidase